MIRNRLEPVEEGGLIWSPLFESVSVGVPCGGRGRKFESCRAHGRSTLGPCRHRREGSRSGRLAAVGAAAIIISGTAPRSDSSAASVEKVVDAGSLGALLLVDDGSSRKEKTSGLAVMRGRVPLHAHDRFRVGSITKSFVAVVVLQLVGERQLSLRDTVERWLPGVVPGGGRITLRELLAHRSGLVDYADDVAFVRRTVAQPRRLWTPRELVAVALAEGRVAPPGNGPLPDRSFRP